MGISSSLFFPLSLFVLVLPASCSQDKEEPLHYEEVVVNVDSLAGKKHNPSLPHSASTCSQDTLTVSHWNIGHFSLGTSDNTKIKEKDAEEMAEKYHAMLDTLHTDVFGVCEFNVAFTRSDTRTILFGDYPFFCNGNKFSYNLNAIFSRIKIQKSKAFFFKDCVQKRYFLEAALSFGGTEITFVETHLDWNQGNDGAACRKSQMKELADRYTDYDHVIICADYNSSGMNEFDVFKKKGFQIANDGSVNTYPATNPSRPIDNIVFKGFDILRIESVRDQTLSDHCLLRCSLKVK